MADDELDKELAKGLEVAKKKPRNFAIIAKGQNILKMLVDKKPIKDGALTKAKKDVPGGFIVQGVVRGDGQELVFQVREESSLSDLKLKKFIGDTTGLTLKPRFSVVAALQEVDDDSPDDALPPNVASVNQAPVERAPVVSSPSVTDPALAQLLAAMNKLAPALQLAIKSQPQRKDELMRAAAEFQTRYASGDATAAKESLLNLGKLIKEATNPSGDDSLAQRMQQLEPELLKAVKANPGKATALMNVWNHAQEKAAAGDQATVEKILERLEQAVAEALKTAPQTDTERFGIQAGLVAERRAELEEYLASRVSAARAKTEIQIQSVEKAIAKHEPDAGADKLAAAVQEELNSLYNEVRAELIGSLDAEDADSVLRTINAWRERVAANPLVRHLARAKSDIGATADILDDFEALFEEVSNKVRQVMAA